MPPVTPSLLFEPKLVKALATIVRAKGRAYRSNYTADHPGRFGWQVHYAAIDALERRGLIMRVGRFYDLTEAGRHAEGGR